MDALDPSPATDAAPVPAKATGFLSHMFSLDPVAKAQLQNLIQYSCISIIPVVLLLKLIQHFITEHDPSKSNVDLIMECIGQIGAIVVGLWFIDRFVRYFTPYSGVAYSPFAPTTFIAPLILIMVTMQSKLGQKMTTLTNRATAMAGLGTFNSREGMTSGSGSKVSAVAKEQKPSHHEVDPAPKGAGPPKAIATKTPGKQQTMSTQAKEEHEAEAFSIRSHTGFAEQEPEAFGFGGGGLSGSSF